MLRILKKFASALLLACCAGAAAAENPFAAIDAQIAARPGQTGALVMERGADALVARAWLTDHARESIEVQYFIWSTDNIGMLATESLLRAADRGVKVRVIVDDLLIDAPDESLLALARHPNVEIRIYNPQTSVGVPLTQRIINVVSDFRAVNQRMHDKTFVADGKVAITGGRNMAAEYFDYNHDFNFRDRDVLLLGAAAGDVQKSFNTFWASPLSVPVRELYNGLGVLKKNVRIDDATARRIYKELHAYAKLPENFAPEVRAAVEAVPQRFPELARALIWGPAEFIHDVPGKNSSGTLGGGGRTSAALGKLIAGAQERIVIQSPYLVVSEPAMKLFADARRRGVKIRISTNSLASTDNLQAYSGYRNQRQDLLELGIEVFEFRPDAQVQRELQQRIAPLRGKQPPVYGLHAKTLVVDGSAVYIGTFNLDPRSENLNTEVGAILRDPRIAAQVELAIETDMRPENSWNAATDDPDRYVGWLKRGKAGVFRLLPIKPLL